MNIKRFFLSLVLIMIFILINNNCVAQKTSEIIYALKTGNTEKLVTFFKPEIELSVNGNNNTYSLAQAENILKRFFNENKPVSFKILHEGNQSDAYYLIGTLITEDNTFRTSIFMRTISKKNYIYQLRIENEYN
ncbi:MAG: DUF4783 domain-containing protein [Chlorobi bacterium]|nr:DUF4783 domain-containing protein [Chlorobiota bacterium]